MRRFVALRTAAESLVIEEHRPAADVCARDVECLDRDDLPVSAALLRARRAVSFATPGHRGGRSCEPGR